jgi:hypothetical protein
VWWPHIDALLCAQRNGVVAGSGNAASIAKKTPFSSDADAIGALESMFVSTNWSCRRVIEPLFVASRLISLLSPTKKRCVVCKLVSGRTFGTDML